MSKPNITIPSGFGGIKADFDNDHIMNGFPLLTPDVLAGDNLNKFIDDTYKGLNGTLELFDGCVLYDENNTYNNKSIVFNIDSNNKTEIYRSLINNNSGNPLSDDTAWEKVNFGISLIDILSAIYPIGSIYSSATHSNVCPLESLFTSTWTKIGSTIVTGVSSTTSTSASVSVKGNGMTLGVTHGGDVNFGLVTTASYGIHYDTNSYGKSVGTAPSTGALNYKSFGVTTDSTKSGLTGSVTIPSLTPSTTTLTVYLWQRTA